MAALDQRPLALDALPGRLAGCRLDPGSPDPRRATGTLLGVPSYDPGYGLVEESLLPEAAQALAAAGRSLAPGPVDRG